MTQAFYNCHCCKRTALGLGLCDRCKPSTPDAGDGCTPTGYGGWRRTERCRVRSLPAARSVAPKPRDPRCTGRMQGSRKAVQCCWCSRKFPVWTKSEKDAGKVSWHGAVKDHCQRQHPRELRELRVDDPAKMVRDKVDARAARAALIEQAAKKLRGNR